ncbi:M20 family metallopeptidase [uncultured Desulfosarcina sp.]|uniref:M20 family metallopeptidase n=1 Tax=uncultured Desulfosarcina sp. TaxID=218289 RepID=UPI0029C7AD69|nr:M20 family metallopeptidase [uncultured Desulfosarcina sp.]
MPTDIQAFMDGRVEKFISDLETLVNIDSGSDNLAGIEAVARVLDPRLKAIGFTTCLKKLGTQGVPCLEAFNVSEEEKSDILFLGHMDTVFPDNEAAKRPFSMDGRRATGPGVSDMKGGLVLALHTLEALHDAGVLDRLAVRVCFNGDEEVGSKASRRWIENHALNSRRVFVFEPCRPAHRFVLNRKGGGVFTITASGVSAHAGVEPEKGANAAVEIAHQVLAVQRFNDDAEKGISAHVTVLRSGEKTNIIPDKAQAKVDVRVARKDQIARVESFFRSMPDRTHVPGVSLTVRGAVERPPMEADDRAMALWRLFEKKAESIGLTVDATTTGGCSDGNWSSALGIPTIDGMGPVGGNAHRSDEYVDLSSIVPQIQLIASVCQSIARQS